MGVIVIAYHMISWEGDISDRNMAKLLDIKIKYDKLIEAAPSSHDGRKMQGVVQQMLRKAGKIPKKITDNRLLRGVYYAQECSRKELHDVVKIFNAEKKSIKYACILPGLPSREFVFNPR